jgi:NTP pyrophosphatase (non-canonical NTP hydrolase)
MMQAFEYVNAAMRTNKDMGTDMNIVHAAMLLCTESGEIMSEVKRNFAYGKPLDTRNIIEELGDVLWGVALMCTQMGVTMESVMEANIAKLAARYPNLSFDADRAINRDKAAEQEAIAGVRV